MKETKFQAGTAFPKREAPLHPSLGFEERHDGICVARIGNHHRAVGLREGGIIAWFWIGTHEEYNNFAF